MDKRSSNSIPELWGGLECSFNRVRDTFMDQIEYSGHYARGERDIKRFASLGIRAIRYPVIWEKHQNEPGEEIDWRWTEKQLHAIRAHDIQPIAGLMHHGNGPPYTDLLNELFPVHFANYAATVARRFPWLDLYTPINEPLTTARFSGLYGLWYPHRKADRDFAIMLLHQVKAIVLAMKAIRQVNPGAKLLQTEDLAKTYSTPLLRYQAEFENERRWLTYDLLCGMFNEKHPLWDYFSGLRLPQELLHFFEENPCPPDFIGADHYLTSERFLDERWDRYPHHPRGGNHIHHYVDVEAIRVNHGEPSGLKTLLSECWERYGIPIAISEVHIHGNSREQIQWFQECWKNAIELGDRGIPVVAVTSWSLLGAFGWNKLLTEPRGEYEQGAFHVGSGQLRRTKFAKYLEQLSKDPYHEVAFRRKGWWQQESRCLYNQEPACEPYDVALRQV